MKYKVLLWSFIGAYIIYFSYFTVLRYQTLYASYFDLGIMHQTVFNTYKALQTGDYSRFLEFTDPLGSSQIKRMAFHNDILLALLVPFYFINDSPATLLILQSAVVALGALAIFLITGAVFNKSRYKNVISLAFSVSYLLNPVLQRANIYDFHAVVFATTMLLFMFYFWLKKRYKLSFLFLILSLMTKEQIPLTTAFFGFYTLFKDKKNYRFSLGVIITSIVWFVASVFLVIPYFRGGDHFALERYNDFSPVVILKRIFHWDTFRYLFFLLGPVGFLSLFSLPVLFIAIPEFAINLLSSNWNMRNIIYQYTAVIQPFIFISAIYGARKISNLVPQRAVSKWLVVYILAMTFIFAYFKGPLPFSREKEVHPFHYPQKERFVIRTWADKLKDERLKISTTGQLSPFFTNRRYFYNFSKDYHLADYVVLRLNEIYNYPDKNKLIPIYKKLILDPNYVQIYHAENFEVYKKINSKSEIRSTKQ